jgi:cob(I)alamin adenosyltransferase
MSDAAVGKPALSSTDGSQAARSLLHIYTGQGKGKTTAAFGVAFRALGWGQRVAIVQFIKGKWKTGERAYAESIPQLTFFVMGHGFTWESDDLSVDKKAAIEAWKKSKELIQSAEYDIVILDELTYVINYGFVPLAEIVETIAARPARTHVIITGRKAAPELIEMADLVTEMQSIKHPYKNGVPALRGLDF